MRDRACLCLLACLAGSALAKAPDKPADFLIDITSVTEKRLGILVRTKKNVWQLPKSQVRKGFGLAFYSVKRNLSNHCESRMYIEVEPLEGRSLREAFDQTVGALKDVMAPFDTELIGTATSGEREQFRFGRTVVLGYRAEYTVDITTAVPRSQSPATAIVFEHEKALVTVTVEDFDAETDMLTPFLKSIAIVDLPVRERAVRVKMIDAENHIYRYMTAVLPGGLVPQHAESPHDAGAMFQRLGKDGKVAARFVIKRIRPPRGRAMDFAKAMEWTRSNYLDMYDDVSAVRPGKVGGREAYLLSYTDREEDKRRVQAAFVELHDQLWTWTFESAAGDAKGVKKADGGFAKVLKSMDVWVAKP